MDSTIVLILLQDGLLNGAIYALLGLALVLVFAVTRVIFIPQGEFVTFGALTLAFLVNGQVPGTVHLLLIAGSLVFLFELIEAIRNKQYAGLWRTVLWTLALPGVLYLLLPLVMNKESPLWVLVLFSMALVVPLGPMIYRLVYQRVAEASVLVLLITSVAVHFALTGLGLVFFGNTLYGRALRATAVNRRGARLVGISTIMSGRITFTLAAAIGTLSGMLIAPVTTIYYDTGFLIGLKGFVAAIVGGLASYPLTAAGAIFVGILEAFSSFWASSYKEVIVFTLIIPVLLWRSFGVRHVDDED